MAGISNAAVAGQASNPITETLTNTTTAAVNVTYLITPIANGCAGPVFSYVVTVNPTPAVSAATGTVCSGAAENYSITSATAGTTFSWGRAAVAGISNAAAVGQVTNFITETLTNTTTAAINVTLSLPSANGCAGPVFSYVVTVNPSPTVSSAATGTVCSGVAEVIPSPAQRQALPTAGTGLPVAGISNAAAVGQVTNPITETLTNTTANPVNVTYLITPTANGCAGPVFSYVVTVNPSPTVSSAATGTVCSGAAENYSITSATAGTTYSWGKSRRSRHRQCRRCGTGKQPHHRNAQQQHS